MRFRPGDWVRIVYESWGKDGSKDFGIGSHGRLQAAIAWRDV